MAIPRSLAHRLVRPMLLVALLAFPGAALAQRGGGSAPVPADVRQAMRFDPADSAGLFVGISEFDQEEQRLMPIPYAVDDAVDLAHLFVVELGLIAPDKAVLALAGEPQNPESQQYLEALLDRGVRRTERRPSQSRLLRLLKSQARRAGNDGLFVVSIASHGYDGYVVAADSVLSLVADTGVAISRLFEEVARSRTQRRLVLIDACREKLTADSPPRGDPDSALSSSFEQSLGAATGQVILLGATSNGFAYDDTEIQNGVFSGAVIAGLRGLAPVDSRGMITANELGSYVNDRVKDWVAENRPHHVELSRGIQMTFEGDAAEMPLAADAASLEARRQLAQRRQAALVLLKKSFVDGDLISANDVDRVKSLLSGETLAVAEMKLLEWVEKLDETEASQRAMLQYLAALPEPGGAKPRPGPSSAQPAAAVEARRNEPAESQPADLAGTQAEEAFIKPLPVVLLDLESGSWEALPAAKAFRFRFALPDYETVYVVREPVEGVVNCGETLRIRFYIGERIHFGAVDTSELPEGVEWLGPASEVRTMSSAASADEWEIRVPALELGSDYCFGFTAWRRPDEDQLSVVQDLIAKVIDERTRERSVPGSEATDQRRFVRLRKELAGIIGTELPRNEERLRPRNADFFDLSRNFPLEDQHLKAFASLTQEHLDGRADAIAKFETEADWAAHWIGRIAGIEPLVRDGLPVDLSQLLSEEDAVIQPLERIGLDTGVDLVRFLGLPTGRRRELIEGGPPAVDLWQLWQDPGDDRVKTIRSLSEAIHSLSGLARRAGVDLGKARETKAVPDPDGAVSTIALTGEQLVSSASTSLETLAEHLEAVHASLHQRSEAVATWTRLLAWEAESLDIRATFVLAVP